MRKTLMTLGLALLLTTSVYGKNIVLNINDTIVSTPVPPIQEAGTTLVPLRIIGENLGATLGWDSATKTVTINKEATEIKLVINSKKVWVDGESKQLLLPPKLINGTTMVPLRFISENLGSNVHWDSSSRTVFVMSQVQRYYTNISFYEGDQEENYSGEVILRDGVEVFDGLGLYFYNNGDFYEGEFKDGLRHGHGAYYYADGTLYEGESKADIFHGQGKMIYTNGEMYEGGFKEDLFYGEGQYIYYNGDIYKGEFKDGMRHGEGQYIYDGGDIFIGESKADMFHGQGKYIYANGDIYVGEFKEMMFHGQGKMIYANGNSYEGEYRADQFHGEGKFVYKDGEIQEGRFEYGEFKGESLWKL